MANGDNTDTVSDADVLGEILKELKKANKSEGSDSGSGESRLGGGSGFMSPEAREKLLKVEKELATSEKDLIEINQKLAKIEYDRAAQAEIDFKKTFEPGVKLTREQTAELQRLTIETDKTEKKLKNLAKAQADLNAEQAKGAQGAKTLKNNLFGLSSGLSKIVEIVPTTSAAFKSFGKEMFSWSSIQKMATGGLLKLFDLFMKVAFAADEAQSKFRQNTGAGKEFNNNLNAVRNNLKATGVGFDEASKSLESLYGGMSSFTRMNDGMQTKLAGTVAVYDQLGVSMDVTTGIMDHAVQSLGYDAQGSMDLVKQLDDTAVSLGKNISDVFADFASASKKLSFYGTDMINVFRKLEMQSKDTGLSIDEILGLTEQFDTFEGAGKAVGKLNALLGGPYLNSIDMLNASEDERMEMMKEAMDMSGTMFSDLSKYEQKAFAAAMGTDVDTLRKAMMGLTSEEEEHIKVQKKAAVRAAAAKSAMEGLTLALQSLIEDNKELTGDIMKGIRSFTEWIIKVKGTRNITEDLKNVMKALIAIKVLGFITTIITAMKALGGAIAFLKLQWTRSLAVMTANWIAANTAFTITPVGAIITGIVIAIGLLVLHFKKMRDAGVDTGDAFMDIGQKILMFMGPAGILLSGVISLFKHLSSGKGILAAFGHAILDLANNVSFGVVGYLLEKAAGLMGFEGPEGGFSNTGRMTAMNDGAVLKDGSLTTFPDNDTILAGRPGGGLAGALTQLMGSAMPMNMVSGAASAMGSTFAGQKAAQGFGILDMVKNMALKSLFGPLLKDAITDPIVQALGDGTGDGAGGINVTVYIGQEEVDATIVKALDSQAGRAAILPWSAAAAR
jgi:hypothetical protein